MPIDFLCSACGQMLRVGDDTRGCEARCPNCQNVMVVPAGSASTASASAGREPPAGGAGATGAANPFAPPYSPAFADSAAWPSSGQIVNVPTRVGSVLSYAFTVWKQHLALLAGTMLAIIIVDFAMAYLGRALMHVGPHAARSLTEIAFSAGRFALDSFLSIGFWSMMLKMARRQPTEFADLFSGGPRLLPAIGVSLLLGIAVWIGLVLMVVPGIIVLAIWWPCYLLVIDGQASVTESFGLGRTVTENNVLTSILLGVVSLGISLLGLLAFGIGLIVAAPLASMLFAVAYLMMSGQLSLSPPAFAGQPSDVR